MAQLDAASPAEWEAIFAASPVAMTRDDAFRIVNAKRPYSDWFALRFDAGKPGVALPSFEQAVKKLISGKDGGPLDAYRVIFAERPWPETFTVDVVIALLNNAAVSALKGGTNWFAMWLAARVGLASLALGRPERAWMLLDLVTTAGPRHPHLSKLEVFEPLRGKPQLEQSVWIRRVIWRLWPMLGVPALPRLRLPEPSAAGEVPVEEVLEQLEALGAVKAAGLVRSFWDAMEKAGGRVEEN